MSLLISCIARELLSYYCSSTKEISSIQNVICGQRLIEPMLNGCGVWYICNEIVYQELRTSHIYDENFGVVMFKGSGIYLLRVLYIEGCCIGQFLRQNWMVRTVNSRDPFMLLDFYSVWNAISLYMGLIIISPESASPAKLFYFRCKV